MIFERRHRGRNSQRVLALKKAYTVWRTSKRPPLPTLNARALSSPAAVVARLGAETALSPANQTQQPGGHPPAATDLRIGSKVPPPPLPAPPLAPGCET